MSPQLGVIGVPTSAGAFAPGQEQAPRALREAGLIELLRETGLDVRDLGDRELWRWRPDRENPYAQNLGKVVEIVTETAGRVAETAAGGVPTLVLGGDCTVGLGTVAGHVQTGGRVGLVYFDAHADLNLPRGESPGALDWTGLAHMLGERGTADELVGFGSRTPLLAPEQVVLFGWGPEQAEPPERETIKRRSIEVVTDGEVGADPIAAARRALELLGDGTERLLVHFDVDVINFTDTPLSENPGRNEGIAYDVAIRALEELLRAPALAGLTVTELNPDHAEEGGASIERLARDLAHGLAPPS
jgi:arginase